MVGPQTVFKRTTQNAAQAAQAAAKLVANEAKETFRDIQAQVGAPPTETLQQSENGEIQPQVIQGLREEGPETFDRAAIANQERAMLANLNAQLARLQAKRSQELNTYRETQSAAMQSPASASVENIQPQGKIRKALGKAKKAVTNILSKRKQGESKAGTGKG